MVTTTHNQGARVQARRWALVAVEFLIAANAVYGGVGLIRDGLGMPGEWLESTPFDSWRWPGVFLLLVIAVPMTTAAVLEIARSQWAFAASMLAAVAQVTWIVVQLAVLRRYFFLQPVLFGAGLLVAGLALWSHHGQRRSTEPRGLRGA
jgi:hypothetical protein